MHGLCVESNRWIHKCKGLLLLSMKVDKGHYRLQIYPAKSILFFQLVMILICSGLILLLPIYFGYKWWAVLAFFLVGLRTIINFNSQNPVVVEYRSATHQWIFDGIKVRLHVEQFITRPLLIVYFVTEDGKKLTQLVPADSMSSGQHRCLRKLLIACMQTNPCEQSLPDQQS